MTATKSAAPGTAGAYLPGASGGNTVVNTAAQQAGATANKHTASLGAALAALGGMNDLFQKTDIDLAHNGQAIGQLGNFAAGSRSVLQSELDAAKQKGSTLRALGGLAQSIGGAMLGGGLGAGPINLGSVASEAPTFGVSLPGSLVASPVDLPGLVL
jgi:hypothetical protein